MKKKLIVLLSLVLCMAFAVGCKKNSEEVVLTDDAKSLIVTNMNENFKSWVSFDFKTIYEDDQYEKEMRDQYKAWDDLRKSLGNLTSQTEPVTGKPVLDSDTEKYNVTSTMYGTFENGKIKFAMQFDTKGNFSGETLQIQEEQTTKQIMSKALLNTLMGMGTVFVVLILISLVISSFGLINKQQLKKKEAHEAEQTAPSVSSVMAPPVTQAAEEFVDDGELVAVITAAIMASMGDEAPAEGLVVRSIKRRNASKWKNA